MLTKQCGFGVCFISYDTSSLGRKYQAFAFRIQTFVNIYRGLDIKLSPQTRDYTESFSITVTTNTFL